MRPPTTDSVPHAIEETTVSTHRLLRQNVVDDGSLLQPPQQLVDTRLLQRARHRQQQKSYAHTSEWQPTQQLLHRPAPK